MAADMGVGEAAPDGKPDTNVVDIVAPCTSGADVRSNEEDDTAYTPGGTAC